jgi:molybdenum cofactor cytidylyltransferase
MTRASSFAGVILAAGNSSRMGQDKALLPWPPPAAGRAASNDTFLSAAIRSLSLATEFILVVVGENESALAPTIYGQGAALVVNRDPNRGEFSSLQVGLREVLNHGRDAAAVTLVDRPAAGTETIQSLVNVFEAAAPNIWVVVPEFAGKHGHPYLVGREMIEAFLRAPATSTPREIERQHQEHIQYVEVDDPLVAVDINTREDYAQLLARSV